MCKAWLTCSLPSWNPAILRTHPSNSPFERGSCTGSYTVWATFELHDQIIWVLVDPRGCGTCIPAWHLHSSDSRVFWSLRGWGRWSKEDMHGDSCFLLVGVWVQTSITCSIWLLSIICISICISYYFLDSQQDHDKWFRTRPKSQGTSPSSAHLPVNLRLLFLTLPICPLLIHPRRSW